MLHVNKQVDLQWMVVQKQKAHFTVCFLLGPTLKMEPVIKPDFLLFFSLLLPLHPLQYRMYRKIFDYKYKY